MQVMNAPIAKDRARARGFLWHVGIAWALICVLLLATNGVAIATMRFPDPDDTMRLIQVRDLIAGQGWFDNTQYRVDAPGGGVPMHWSRLVDLPLLLVIVLLTPLLGAPGAELAALVLVPLLTLGCAMLLAARIAWRTLGKEETLLTCALLAIAVPALFQFSPMRIDHHGWQIVCALLAANGFLAGNARFGGRIIGMSLATWLLISIEGLPLAAAIFGVLALRWLRDPAERAWLVSAIQALAATSIALFLLTRGTGDLALHCDAVNPVHLAMFGWGALVLTALGQIRHAPLGVVLAGFAIAGGGALALLLGTARECVTGGGFAALDPLVAKHWYAHVGEGMPLWHQPVDIALQFFVAPTIGLFGAIHLARTAPEHRAFWRDHALVLGAALLISVFVSRAGATACAIAAPALAWQVSVWLRKIRAMETPWRRILSMIAIVFALLPTFPLTLAKAVLPASVTVGPMDMSSLNIQPSDCRQSKSAAVLTALPQGEIYAPLDISPGILVDSDHSVIATGHHRGNEGMRFVIEVALGSSEEARRKLLDRGTDYLALCPDLNEPSSYKAAAPKGFMADLLGGQEPEWLEPIPTAPGTSFRLWRIRPEENRARRR